MAEERLVECQVCGYRWESSAKTPQCTDPNDTCGRSRRVEEVQPDESQDGGDAEQDSNGDEQAAEQPNEQESEQEETQETDNEPEDEDSGEGTDDNDENMVTPTEYQEFHSERSGGSDSDGDGADESASDGLASGESGGTADSLGIDPQLLYGLCLAGAALLALYLLHKRRKSAKSRDAPTTDAETDTPPETEGESEPEPEPEPDPAPREETAAQREMRQQVERTSDIPMFEN